MWDHFTGLFSLPDVAISSSHRNSGEPTRYKEKYGKYQRQVTELLLIFPDCDPFYLEHCCQFYRDNHVERICEKICQHNHSHYPQLPKSLIRYPKCSAAKNVQLEALSELFPDCDTTYLRDLISGYHNNVIYRSINHLLEKDNKYPRRPHFGLLNKSDYFKSEPYILGSQYRLFNQFPKVPRSTIKAVLAETNYNFIVSHDRLSQLALQHNWVSSLLGYLHSKRFHDEPCMYTLELLQDLNSLDNRERQKRIQEDLGLAIIINQNQYEEERQGIPCGCCYASYPFEELAQCDEGHLFCHGCVNRYVSELVHGQVNAKDKPQVPCIDTGGCLAKFSDKELSRCLNQDLLFSYHTSQLEWELERSKLVLARCPFCRYVEVDQEIKLRTLNWRAYFHLTSLLICLRLLNLVLSSNLWHWVLPVKLLFLSLSLIGLTEISPVISIPKVIPHWIIPKCLFAPMECSTLQCQAPECGKLSCRICFQQCLPSHQCLENEKDALRLKVEQAMADAVKRTVT